MSELRLMINVLSTLGGTCLHFNLLPTSVLDGLAHLQVSQISEDLWEISVKELFFIISQAIFSWFVLFGKYLHIYDEQKT